MVVTWLLALALCPPAGLNLEHQTSRVVHPADCNHLGALFGGWTLAEMDRCAGVTVRRLLYASPAAKDAVTVSVKEVSFPKAGRARDLVFVSGKVVALGARTITVLVKAERETPSGRETIALGTFVFCAFDADEGKSVEHGLKLPE